jgi:hypothetical protein
MLSSQPRNPEPGGLVGTADPHVVQPHPAEIDEVLFELARHVRARAVGRFVARRYNFAGPYSCVNSFLRGPA